MAKTFITSSKEKGSVLVSAHADGLQEVTIALNFKEEVFYCLYCGAVTPSIYGPCPNCGRIPP
jgi:rubrerythrin